MKRINYRDIENSPIKDVILNYASEEAFIRQSNKAIKDKGYKLIYTRDSDSICETKEDVISLRNWLNDVIEYMDNNLTFYQAIEYLQGGKRVIFNSKVYVMNHYGILTCDGNGVILTSKMINGIWNLAD